MTKKVISNQSSKLDKSAKCTDKAFLDSMRRVVSSPNDVRDAKSSRRHRYFPRYRRTGKPMPKRNSKPTRNEEYRNWMASSTKYPSFEIKGGYCEVTVEIPCEEQNVGLPSEAESATCIEEADKKPRWDFVRSVLDALFPWRRGGNQKEPMIQINNPTFHITFDQSKDFFAPVEQVAENMYNNKNK